MAWTDDRVDVLRKLWADGLSASQIAAELGGVTRNAVIGKVHRLGLSGRAKNPSSSARKPRTTARSGGYKSPGRPRSTAVGQVAVARQAIVVDIPEPKMLDLKLLNLNENTCKWPVGDPQDDSFGFCGTKARENDPYCEYHCKLAYQPAAERRKGGQKPKMQTRISGNRNF